MDNLHSFREALISFEQVEPALLDTTRRKDAAWKKDYIELRRQLQVRLTALASAGHRIQEANGETGARFRDAFVALRSALALHQATWPAVAIDLSNPDYKASADRVQSASRAFRELAHQAVSGAATVSRA